MWIHTTTSCVMVAIQCLFYGVLLELLSRVLPIITGSWLKGAWQGGLTTDAIVMVAKDANHKSVA